MSQSTLPAHMLTAFVVGNMFAYSCDEGCTPSDQHQVAGEPNECRRSNPIIFFLLVSLAASLLAISGCGGSDSNPPPGGGSEIVPIQIVLNGPGLPGSLSAGNAEFYSISGGAPDYDGQILPSFGDFDVYVCNVLPCGQGTNPVNIINSQLGNTINTFFQFTPVPGVTYYISIFANTDTDYTIRVFDNCC